MCNEYTTLAQFKMLRVWFRCSVTNFRLRSVVVSFNLQDFRLTCICRPARYLKTIWFSIYCFKATCPVHFLPSWRNVFVLSLSTVICVQKESRFKLWKTYEDLWSMESFVSWRMILNSQKCFSIQLFFKRVFNSQDDSAICITIFSCFSFEENEKKGIAKP